MMTAGTRNLRVGIVGTGGISDLHAKAIEAYDRAELVGVTDMHGERARSFAERWSGQRADGEQHTVLAVPDLDALLALDLDVLHICTPPSVHAEQAIRAFAAGVHVVCEKPAALSLAELDSMLEAAERAGRRLAIVFQQRTGTAAEHVRQLLARGALGRPLVASCQTLWYRDQSYFDVPWRGNWATEGGGPTLGHGIHQIDLLAHLLGDWATVSAQLWRVGRETETEDVSTATLTFANGVVASVLTSAVSPRETSSLRIDTDRATVTVDHLYGHSRENWNITPAPGVAAEEAESWRFPEPDVGSGHEQLLREVFDALLADAPLPRVAAAPARSLEIVTAIYSSAATGRIVTATDLRDDDLRVHSLESPVSDLRANRPAGDPERPR